MNTGRMINKFKVLGACGKSEFKQSDADCYSYWYLWCGISMIIGGVASTASSGGTLAPYCVPVALTGIYYTQQGHGIQNAGRKKLLSIFEPSSESISGRPNPETMELTVADEFLEGNSDARTPTPIRSIPVSPSHT